MVRTRNAGRPPAPRASSSGRRNPGRTSRPSKPGALRDSSSDEDADTDFFAHSDNNSEEDETHPTISRVSDAVMARMRQANRHAIPIKRGRKVSIAEGSQQKQPKRPRRNTGSGPSTPRKRKAKPPTTDDTPVYDGFIPNWLDPSISSRCWEDIFHYAASDASSNLRTKWLVDVATVCKAFAEPALSCLYRSPAIKNAGKAKKLAALLEFPVSETWLNYRSRVEELHLDIHVVPQTTIPQLIQPLDRLSELILLTPFDQPPYRELERPIRWNYSEDIFQALLPPDASSELAQFKRFHNNLLSWEWSGRLMGGCVPSLDDIGRVHSTPPFQSLKRVSFTNFQLPSLSKTQRKYLNEESLRQSELEDQAVITAIAHSICQLPSLKHLVFESSTVVSDQMLPLLPQNLTHLDLINCWEVTSEGLASFLKSHGHSMRSLTLHHNQSLNLAFLTTLKENCPSLRELNMNLSYYHLYDTATDSEQMYDKVLLPDQVPQWPSTLRVINVEYVPDWSVETAEMFLQTLIDNAHQLKDLRYLNIKSMLTIPWKQRADFRNSWRNKMEKVFLRHSPPPKDVRTVRPAATQPEAVPDTKLKGKEIETSPQNGKTIGSPANSERGKSLRRKEEGLSYRDPDTDEDENDKTESEDDAFESGSEMDDDGEDDTANAEPALFVQGLCKYVNVTFDNQKVRELQYGMEDFHSDDDDEEEEEWNGDDMEDDDPVLQF